MSKRSRLRLLLPVLGLLSALVLPGAAAAHTDFLALGVSGCAFEDINDNGIFDLGTDIPVADSQWLGGTAFAAGNPFVVPIGCAHTLATVSAPLFGVQVTATKITFLGKIDYLPSGGRGVTLIANVATPPAPGDGSIAIGDGVTPDVKISAGGVNALPTTIPAIPQKSVAIRAGGSCTVNRAELLGNRPIQNTKVGMLCESDITFRQATVVGSKVNIQSLTGQIDGRSFAPPPGATLADLCDDPALNVVGGGGPPGNGNGFLDAGDFPCQLDLSGLGLTPVFADTSALANFCLPSTVGGANKFHAFNDPLIMIAGAGAGNILDLRGAAVPDGQTSIVGRYRVTLVAEDGDILANNALIDHGEQLGLVPPGGARIWLFADPASVVRLPVDREDMIHFSVGTTNITAACFRSVNPVQVGEADGAGTLNLTGTPAPPPCKQNPPDFVPVLDGIF